MQQNQKRVNLLGQQQTKFTKYLGEEVVKKIMFKEKNGEIVEVLDI